MESTQMTDPARSAPVSRRREVAYWVCLAGCYLVMVPNLLNLPGPGGNPWPLWMASPVLGIVAMALAAREGVLWRGVLAFLFGFNALFILNAVVLPIAGP